MVPLSAPSSSCRLRGTTAIDVRTPRKASDRRRTDEKDETGETDVWTPIRLAVVPIICKTSILETIAL